jgi:glycosyltransferase involved in cell wall biosynthesis
MVNFLIPQMRAEDRDAARRLDCVVANSRTVQKRIHDFYGIDAPVIHPPVNTSRFTVSEKDRGYYLIVSRLVAYRNVELAVKTFTRLGKHLVVVGEGPDRQRLEKLAGRTVDFRGFVEERELQQIYADCKAVVVAGEEDFGITPVEAQACGKPVLALGRGGALETVIDGETGVHFREVNVQSMEAGLKKLESLNFHVARLCENAKRFSEEEYVRKITALLQDFVLQSRDRASALLAEVK